MRDNTETFYRVKAGHKAGDWQVGMGDGFTDRTFAEGYYQQCIDGGWPVVRLERVEVTGLQSYPALMEPKP